jgi:uncharacterized membrane protein (DUF373 family)
MRLSVRAIYDKVEKFIIFVLLFLLSVVVLYSTIQLAVLVIGGLLQTITGGNAAPYAEQLLLKLEILHDVFAGFLLILIGLELMKTVVMYLDENVVHVEVVLEVALIAIARHVIEMKYSETSPLTLFGISTITLALAIGFFLFKKATTMKHSTEVHANVSGSPNYSTESKEPEV